MTKLVQQITGGLVGFVIAVGVAVLLVLAMGLVAGGLMIGASVMAVLLILAAVFGQVRIKIRT